jgi:rSAM/selenodomain-associated transferase 2
VNAIAKPRLSTKPRLSIVMPVLNEAGCIDDALAALAPLRDRGCEVIVVDGGSRDGTLAAAARQADKAIAARRGRSRQMNTGASRATGDVFLFLHADTRLPDGADEIVLQAVAAGAGWGRFDVFIEGRPRMLRVIAATMSLRSRMSGIATGDQAMFVHRQLFEQVGGFPDQPLMEDIELSRRLRASGPPACLRQRVATSGRRWEARGVWRTVFLMWRLRWRYWRGESPQSLARAYR